MSYIGNTPTQQAFTPAIDYFSGNGSTTAFTLSRPVASVAQIQAVIENVPQNPSSAYTVSGNTITFTSAPPSGTNNIYVEYTSPITQVVALPQNPQVFGNLQFSSTGARITGNFSSGVASDLVGFQSSTTNGGTAVTVLPNGTGNASYVAFSNSSNPDNSSWNFLGTDGTAFRIDAAKLGTGSYMPMTFNTGGSERMRIDTSGNVGIGTTSVLGNTLLNVNVGIASRTVAGSGLSPYLQLYNGDAGSDLKTWRFGGLSSGSLVVETVNDAYSSATTHAAITSAGLLQFNSGYGSAATAYGCRAWVNFNGIGTVTIRASGNVSSITDNGVGNFTINFTNNMPDVNYAVFGTTVTAPSGNANVTSLSLYGTDGANAIGVAVGSVRMLNKYGTNTADMSNVNVSIFR